MALKPHAQKRYFEYLESKGKMPKKPEHDDAVMMAEGGMVEDENPDEEQGEMDEFVSSGEPHTEDEHEDEHPMEYMAHGGRVKRMAKGGKAPSPGFVKALKRSMY